MRILLPALLFAAAAPASAGITLFNQPGFTGNQHALSRASNNMNFTPRSVKVDGEAWELCPRPFFGGTCLRVDSDRSTLNLPRAFSGTVRSARPAGKAKAEAAGEAKDEKEKPKTEK